MSEYIFTKDRVESLKKNPYVKTVSELAITYTYEFKVKFIEEYAKGKLPREIFEDSGFDTKALGNKRIKGSSFRWRKAYDKNGIIGLADSRKEASGRLRERGNLTNEEIIERQKAKIKLLEGQVELLKKVDRAERRLENRSLTLKTSEIFKLIYQTINKYKFKKMTKYFCELLKVSRSGYYSFLHNQEKRDCKENNDLELRDSILKAFNHRGYKRGSRSIKMTLENEFKIIYNRKRIQRIMRKFNIICPYRKSNPYKKIAKATKEHRVVENKLNRDFKQSIPGKVLLTDITYLPYSGNNMGYLSTIKDASTNEILAYEVSDNLKLDFVLNTIYKLLDNPGVHLTKESFIHSDQGSHYTSPIFQNLLREYNLGQSMSRRGNCWDNAPQESFFGHLKDEIEYKTCKSLKELTKKIDDYMDYYNNYRCQWNLKKMTPVKYRNHLFVA